MNSVNLLCNSVFPQFLVFSENVPTLVYYSHFLVLFIAILATIFIISHGRQILLNQIFTFTMIFFILWVFLDSVFWATNSGDVVMYIWSLQILFEPLVYMGSFYLIYVLVNKEDLPFNLKLLSVVLFIPIIIYLPTDYILSGFNVTTCLSEENPFSFYSYFIEILFTIWMVFIAIRAYLRTTDLIHKKQIFYVTSGVFLFLFFFSWGNIISSITENWSISQIGLFALPIFIGFLVYSIVKFRTFRIKLLATQVLVISLDILIAAQFLYINTTTSYILNSVALLLVIIFGNSLIKSIKIEVEQRERLEQLSKQLIDANSKLEGLDKLKTEFLGLASHQLRSPLTAIRGYSSMIVDGDYGPISPEIKEASERILQSSKNLVKIVEELLNVSKIEQGGMTYEMAPFNLKDVAFDMEKDLSIVAENKGLKISFTSDDSHSCIVNGDKEKIRQVVLNLIDNSIKYTKEGTIHVSVTRKDNKVLFSVKDTGMGMTPEIKATLFQKFNRGEGARMNTSGSGLGLYLAKEIVEAHKGRVWVDSDGPGKGSTFSMELNAVMN